MHVAPSLHGLLIHGGEFIRVSQATPVNPGRHKHASAQLAVKNTNKYSCNPFHLMKFH